MLLHKPSLGAQCSVPRETEARQCLGCRGGGCNRVCGWAWEGEGSWAKGNAVGSQESIPGRREYSGREAGLHVSGSFELSACCVVPGYFMYKIYVYKQNYSKFQNSKEH